MSLRKKNCGGKTSSTKSCKNVTKPNKIQKSYDGFTKRTKRILSIITMSTVLFFWYFSLNNIRYYIILGEGYTTIGNLMQTTLSVVSGLIYTYLIVGFVNPKYFNVNIAISIMFGFALLSVFTWILFPIPWH